MKTLQLAFVVLVMMLAAGTAHAQAPKPAPVLRIMDSANPAEPVTLESIPINNVSVSEVMRLLDGMPYFPALRADEASYQISVVGTATQIAQIRADIAKFDRPKDQFRAEFLVIDTSGVVESSSGINWSFASTKPDKNGVFRLAFDGLTLGFTDARNGSLLTNLAYYAGKDKLKTMAKPQTVARDGEYATIFIGRDIVLTVLNSLGIPGTTSASAGIKIEVQIHAIDNNQVLVNFNTDVSEPSPSIGGYLTITRRQGKNRVCLKDGETFSLAGLTFTSDYGLTRGIPFLKDLPLIGGLFRQKQANQFQQEVAILCTIIKIVPGVVPPVIATAIEEAVKRGPGSDTAPITNPKEETSPKPDTTKSEKPAEPVKK